MIYLTVAAALDQVYKWLDAVAAHFDSLLDWVDINTPHFDREIITTSSEKIASIRRSTKVRYLVGMRDQTHSLIGIAIKWQLDQTNDLFGCGID